MHRSWLAVLGSLAIFFLVAAVPAPLLPPVKVVVYPLIATGSAINGEASSQLATQIATEMAQGGGVSPIPPKPGVARADYLSEARASGAEYYITGFIAPLGTGVSIVEQVVSAQSGVVIFSNSGQIQTLTDANGQGDILAAAIVHHAARNLGAYNAPPAAPSAAPTVASTGSETNLGKLFGKKKKAAPAPKPLTARSPVPRGPAQAALATAAPSAPGVALLALGGSADAERKSAAAQALAAWFARNGRRAVPVTATAPSADVCKTADANAIVGGSLDARPEGSQFGQTTATATLLFIAYDCAGNATFRRSFDRDAGGPQGATIVLDRLASAAVGAYLHPPKR